MPKGKPEYKELLCVYCKEVEFLATNNRQKYCSPRCKQHNFVSIHYGNFTNWQRIRMKDPIYRAKFRQWDMDRYYRNKKKNVISH